MSANVPASIIEEASLWFAKRRRGLMSIEDRAALEIWQREPANAAAMAELEQVWATLQIAQGHIGPDAAPVVAARAPKIAASALLAVMCAASIAIGVISYSGNHEFWTTLDWVDR
jgi:ferric-dicitrate binding protein FerR (iron transport regulator)